MRKYETISGSTEFRNSPQKPVKSSVWEEI